MESKFRANPYNLNNQFVDQNDIINIMKSLNIADFPINNLSYYKTAFIHKSYCKLSEYEGYEYPGNEYMELQDNPYEKMEFLGDSILGSVVCSYIYERFCETHNQFIVKLSIINKKHTNHLQNFDQLMFC